jgi:pimeloyl-ACP methyl ester carboxylesterase
MGDIDVVPLLAQVTTPTLVLHARSDAVAPFDGGRKMASTIPGARFVPLESANHLLIENEPAWPRFLTEIRNFLA